MKISKSKQELARIISENGGWREGAEWAAQDSTKDDYPSRVCFFKNKPKFAGTQWRDGRKGLACHSSKCIEGCASVPSWHQSCLSRAEYFHLYPDPAPDADGWIEWRGGECPVGGDVCVKFRNGATQDVGMSAYGFYWKHDGDIADIIAYRPHNPEQANSDQTGLDEQVWTNPPTIEQLAADYHAKLAIATQAQEEADSHRCGAEVALSKLEIAAKELGFKIEPITAKQGQELVITDWRDLRVGDEIEVFDFDDSDCEHPRKAELMSGICVVMRTGDCVRIELKSNLPKKGSYWNAQGVDKCKFRFIRRP